MVEMETLRIPLRIVFYKDGSDWIAHCLEFDLCGDGTTEKEALERLSQAILIQLEASVKHRNFRNLFTPADGELFRRFAAGKTIAVGEVSIQSDDSPVIIERTEAREYSDDLPDDEPVSA